MRVYQPDIYHIDNKNTCRFALGISGKNTLFVIGLNPSTADDQRPDPTIRKVMGFAERAGFDSFVMLNLYPQRTPFPDKLHRRKSTRLLNENIQFIRQFLPLDNEITLLAAWGAPITKRKYLVESLAQLVDMLPKERVHWKKIGSFTKQGHPRHPVRCAYRHGFTAFDVPAYIDHLQSK